MKKGSGILKTLRNRTIFTFHPHKPKKMDPSERYCFKPELRWNPQLEEYFVKAYGAEHFARISEALMRPSCYSCIRVNPLRSTTNAVIEKLRAVLQEKGCENAAEGVNALHHSDDVAYSSLESSATAAPTSKSNNFYDISTCEISGLGYVVFLKGSGPHTIDYGVKEDMPPKEVIVSRKCAEAVLRGAQVYVPGVLACSGHVEKGELVAVSVSVEQPGAGGGWVVGITRGIVLQGSETDPYHSERSGLYIGRGTAALSRSGMFRASQGIAVDLTDRVYSLPSFHNLLEGEIFLQNLPSIITAHALDPQEGEKILDMCAAPGGKTTAIAILMKDKGEIIAVDRSHNKVLDIQKLAAEMGLKCITTYKLDSLKSVQHIEYSDIKDSPHSMEKNIIQMPGLDKVSEVPIGDEQVSVSSEQAATLKQLRNEKCNDKAERKKKIPKVKNGPGRSNSLDIRAEKSKGFLPNSFDRVLLDAPCSALGLRPRLFSGEDTVESLRKHATYQKRMFDQAVQLVRPGGVVVYSTCTINPGENEALVRYALDKYKFLSLAPQHPKVGGPGLLGGCQFSDGYKEEWLRSGEEDLVQRFDPSSHLDTIGFFIAKFSVGCKDT